MTVLRIRAAAAKILIEDHDSVVEGRNGSCGKPRTKIIRFELLPWMRWRGGEIPQ